MELSARRVITRLSFDDDVSLINEYLSKVSKHILENSSRNRRAESISNIINRKRNDHRNIDLIKSMKIHTDKIICCT